MTTVTRSLLERLYQIGLARRRARFSRPIDEGVPIVSVGNLSLGGTGKTPMVRWLARRALEGDLRPAIVSRGYGGSLSKVGAVASDGLQVLASAREVGDEPIEHARSVPGVPVVIGRDRHLAVRRARDLGAALVILDDGFSYWSLARVCDIVLLDARCPLGNGRLLPRGRLREEPEALARAHAIVMTRADRATPEELERSRNLIARYSHAPIWTARHTLSAIVDGAGDAHAPEVLGGVPVLALSALASNSEFRRTLDEAGAHVMAHVARRDHHAWAQGEIERAAEQARHLGAGAIVTTGKDAPKIEASWARGVEVWRAHIEMEIEHGDDLWRCVRERLDGVSST